MAVAWQGEPNTAGALPATDPPSRADVLSCSGFNQQIAFMRYLAHRIGVPLYGVPDAVTSGMVYGVPVSSYVRAARDLPGRQLIDSPTQGSASVRATASAIEYLRWAWATTTGRTRLLQLLNDWFGLPGQRGGQNEDIETMRAALDELDGIDQLQIADPNLWAQWPLNQAAGGNILDFSGRRLDLPGANPQWQATAYGGPQDIGLYLPHGSYLSVPAGHFNPTTAITLAAWVAWDGDGDTGGIVPPGVEARGPGIICKMNLATGQSAQFNLFIWVKDSHAPSQFPIHVLSFAAGGNTAHTGAAFPTSFFGAAGRTHVAASWCKQSAGGDGVLKIYLNGVRVHTATTNNNTQSESNDFRTGGVVANTTMVENNAPVQLGARYKDAAPDYNRPTETILAGGMYLSDVRLYDRQLSAGEIGVLAFPDGSFLDAGTIGLGAWINYPLSDNPGISWSAVGLPPGIRVSAGGLLHGAPTQLGTFPAVITATAGTISRTWQCVFLATMLGAP